MARTRKLIEFGGTVVSYAEKWANEVLNDPSAPPSPAQLCVDFDKSFSENGLICGGAIIPDNLPSVANLKAGDTVTGLFFLGQWGNRPFVAAIASVNSQPLVNRRLSFTVRGLRDAIAGSEFMGELSKKQKVREAYKAADAYVNQRHEPSN